MPNPLSNDLRLRVVKFVEAGHSRHEAARQFATSVSFVVNLMTLYVKTGSVMPRPRGGLRHSKLNQHRVFILRQVERQDIHHAGTGSLSGKVQGRASGSCHIIALAHCQRPQL
jgi:transposase